MSHIELAKPVTNIIEKTIGPGFIGFTIALSLWGISIAQTVFYYWSFPRDARANKLTVAFLILAECINTALLSDMYWEMLVVNKSPGYGLPKFPWQLMISFVVVTLITFFVQGFFTIRVWRVTRGNVPVIVFISITLLIEGVVLMYCSAKLDPEGFPTDPARTPLARLPFAAALVCDAAIAGSLTYYFNSYRTGMPRTEPVMQQLIWLSMNTGVLHCIVNGLTWILWETDPGGAQVLASQLMSSKLYVNSMLATLNSRKHFRAVVERSIDYTINLDAFDTGTLATE